MIDLNAEKYIETTFTNLHLKDTYLMQHWIHCIIGFSSSEMPNDMEDPEILVILDEESKEILQVILREEGCDSPNYQLTTNEKEQIKQWLSKEEIE
ncbi:hypothetical protein J2S74_000507 [Evansella vedderi]|uniref:Uncharacterized protein n=1 Tax=Evansella vedderi TaxID=38282 RepID=A0ABT9ZSI2_9BACI|nr:hypothetical protein [Evansella vedderi]MDQ0253135.1 hypothetical protein [Evansella vedderi]